MTGLLFLHGWGYAPCAWDGWLDRFPGRPVVRLDAGYFGPARMDIPDNPDGGWVGVGHSLGFAKLLGMHVPWRGLVGFGAFLRFCSGPGKPAGTPPELIDIMLNRLDEDPVEMLRRFTRRCGQRPNPTDPPIPSPDAEGVARLADDLRLLRSLDAQPRATAPPCLLLHAQDDRIAPAALALEAAEALPGARIAFFPAGGHALPFAKPDECLPVLKEFLDGLR
ncbi:MAG: hypothetical protein AUJ49_07935 [Desulfovibrionaceae bacterium CG1_02_65_16]|nr:MAG: hypothetical protein AUJ49_07935 [Desulfovibrionaceae bacterium CG1_02_65_16]